jgi:hypothetical protein
MLPGTRRHASQVELLDYLTDSTWFDFLGLIGKPAMCPVRQQQLLNEAKSVRELAKTFDVHIATVYWLSAAVALSRLSVPLLPKPCSHVDVPNGNQSALPDAPSRHPTGKALFARATARTPSR